MFKMERPRSKGQWRSQVEKKLTIMKVKNLMVTIQDRKGCRRVVNKAESPGLAEQKKKNTWEQLQFLLKYIVYLPQRM